MEEYLDIVQFSRDLYLNFLPIFMRPHNLKKLNPPKHLKTVVKALHDFASCFYPKIQQVFVEQADQIIDTDEQFLKYAIPRCLNLIDEDKYHFSFMLVAAFIGLLQYCIHHDCRCFRFMLSGYKCLVAVFFRGLEKDFETHGGWKGLRRYCEEVVQRVKSIQYPRRKVVFQALIGGGKASRERMSKFIRSCDRVDGNFELNESEKILLDYEDISRTSYWCKREVGMKDDIPGKVKWTVQKLTYTVEVTMMFDMEAGVLEFSIESKKCVKGPFKVKSTKFARKRYRLKDILDAPLEPGSELKVSVDPEPCEGETGSRNFAVEFLPCLVKRSVSTESNGVSYVGSSPGKQESSSLPVSLAEINLLRKADLKRDQEKIDDPSLAASDKSESCVDKVINRGDNEPCYNLCLRNKVICNGQNENGIAITVKPDADHNKSKPHIDKTKRYGNNCVNFQSGCIETTESKSKNGVSGKERTTRHESRVLPTVVTDIERDKDRPAVLNIAETQKGEVNPFCLYNPSFLHILQFFTDDVAEIEDADRYDRNSSARHCGRCGYQCYQYAKYLYKKHRDLAWSPVFEPTKDRMKRSVHIIKTVFSR